jgi:hypothetical protein
MDITMANVSDGSRHLDLLFFLFFFSSRWTAPTRQQSHARPFHTFYFQSK